MGTPRPHYDMGSDADLEAGRQATPRPSWVPKLDFSDV
jgi:hypothetical protein